jgi:PEP-CTERM motif
MNVAIGRTPGAQDAIAEQQNSAPLLPFGERSDPANVGLSSAFLFVDTVERPCNLSIATRLSEFGQRSSQRLLIVGDAMTFVTRMASGTAIGAALLIGLSAPSAWAGYVVDLTQVGSDVVASGSGRIDLTDLTSEGSPGILAAGIQPNIGFIAVASGIASVFSGISGPSTFGTGGDFTQPTNFSGDPVTISISEGLGVPDGYTSGSPLSDTSTYDGATFASLGVTPGRYEWTWGSGANQNFTLVIGGAVPEPSIWAMMLLGFAGLGFAGYKSSAKGEATDGIKPL